MILRRVMKGLLILKESENGCTGCLFWYEWEEYCVEPDEIDCANKGIWLLEESDEDDELRDDKR